MIQFIDMCGYDFQRALLSEGHCQHFWVQFWYYPSKFQIVVSVLLSSGLFGLALYVSFIGG